MSQSVHRPPRHVARWDARRQKVSLRNGMGQTLAEWYEPWTRRRIPESRKPFRSPVIRRRTYRERLEHNWRQKAVQVLNEWTDEHGRPSVTGR